MDKETLDRIINQSNLPLDAFDIRFRNPALQFDSFVNFIRNELGKEKTK